MGSIRLNENNPLGLTHFNFSTFNRVVSGNTERIFNVIEGDQINFNLIYNYMVSNNYYPTTMQMTPENIAHIKAGEEPYLTNYKEQYYPLAGGINGGWLAFYGSDGSVGFTFLSENSVYSSVAIQPTYEVSGATYDVKAYYVDDMHYNGVPMNDGYNRGFLRSPIIIEKYETSGTSGGIYVIEHSETSTPALLYDGDVLYQSPIIRRNPNITSYGNGLRGDVEWWDDFVENSDLKYDEDPQGDQGYSGPDGGNGIPQESVDIPISPLPPSVILQSGIIRTYLPTIANMKAFVDYIYSQPDAFYNNIKKMWANPMESLISFALVPYTVTGSGNVEEVKFCGVSTNIQMEYTEEQYIDVDCGTCVVPEEYMTLLDYSNYTKTKLFLPFIGIVEINTDEIMGATSHLVYHCDILTGEVIAELEISKEQRPIYNIRYNSVLYSYKGNFLTSVPLTGNNYQQLYSGVLNLITAVALPTPASVAGVGADILGQKVTVQRSGNLTSNGGALGGYLPYFIFEKPIRSLPEFNQKYNGYPANMTKTLTYVSGYTEIEKGTFRTTDFARKILDEEAQELISLLEGGVIL